MLETNIRVVRPGCRLYLCLRRAAIKGPDLSPDLLQRACGVLRNRHGLAALPYGDSKPSLVVATQGRVPFIHLEQEEWILDISDAGEASYRVFLTEGEGTRILPLLIERAFLAEISRRTNLWTLDSPRIWYEEEPFRIEDEVAAFRRFEVGSLYIEGVGVGVAVDVGTAFFTTSSLAYFFDMTQPHSERRNRRARFEELTRRQPGQKGTLLYENGRSKVKCYFEDAPEEVTCGSTGKIRVKGKTYDSLLGYYRSEIPELQVSEATPAVRVSFPGIERPQYVAADRVYIRVMNDNVPDSLSNVDKMSPADRRYLLQEFWNLLGPNPLGDLAPGFYNGFWRPKSERITYFIPVGLEFGQGRYLAAPKEPSAEEYKEYYRNRSSYLDEAGCYSIPPSVERTIYCAFPRAVEQETRRQLAGDMAAKISKWTRRHIVTDLVEYDTVAQAIEQLRRANQSGTVIFVLDEEPAAYHEAAFHLSGWRIKRITQRTLRQHYRFLKEGAWDRRKKIHSSQRGRTRWEQFIAMNALDVLQQMDCVPWRPDHLGPYEAHLAIDVGHDRRHFALSLLIARTSDKSPSFGIHSKVLIKPDYKRETINAVMLSDEIVLLFERALGRRFDAINSLLILRDGQVQGDEPIAIDQAVNKLIERERIVTGARIDLLDFHKDTLKSLRLWEISVAECVSNPLEGTAVLLRNQTVLVSATGQATLPQGTAQPFLLVGNGRCPSILDGGRAVFASAQLNWSSPGVAQRLPLELKRTDDELAARADQEIRRIS
jgi:hypothetical protein